MEEKRVNFPSIKKKLENEGYPKAANMGAVGDIPKAKIFELIERLKKVNTQSK